MWLHSSLNRHSANEFTEFVRLVSFVFAKLVVSETDLPEERGCRRVERHGRIAGMGSVSLALLVLVGADLLQQFLETREQFLLRDESSPTSGAEVLDAPREAARRWIRVAAELHDERLPGWQLGPLLVPRFLLVLGSGSRKTFHANLLPGPVARIRKVFGNFPEIWTGSPIRSVPDAGSHTKMG